VWFFFNLRFRQEFRESDKVYHFVGPEKFGNRAQLSRVTALKANHEHNRY